MSETPDPRPQDEPQPQPDPRPVEDPDAADVAGDPEE